MDEKKLQKLIEARKAKTRAELTEAARVYILEQAGLDPQGKPVK